MAAWDSKKPGGGIKEPWRGGEAALHLGGQWRTGERERVSELRGRARPSGRKGERAAQNTGPLQEALTSAEREGLCNQQ